LNLRLAWRTSALRIEPQIHLKSLQKPIKIAFIFAERRGEPYTKRAREKDSDDGDDDDDQWEL